MLTIDESTLLGRGGSKDVYIDPRDEGRCIKIVRDGSFPRDLRMETRYRKVRKWRHQPESELLVGYYGTVETNLGTGYVFERVRDYDGQTSWTIEQLIEAGLADRHGEAAERSVARTRAEGKALPELLECLLRFREVLFRENIIIPDMGAFNFSLQFSAPDVYRIRVTDDIGTPTLIPVVLFIDRFAASHVRRRWKKFIHEIMTLWPEALTREESEQLLSW